MSQFSRPPHAAEPDPGLRARFHAGDAEAMAEIAALFIDDIWRLSNALLGDAELAGEAVQETFLRLLERHRLYQPARAFRPWLLAVCRNTCLGLLRERSAHAARVVDLDPSDEEVARLAGAVPPTLEVTLRDELETAALAALNDLPETTRTILVLHLFEELTFREISDMVGRPANTVATTYYRALAQLRAQISPENQRRSSHGS